MSMMNLSRCGGFSHCTSTALLTGIIYGTMSIKRDLINVYSERYEGPRQLLSYTENWSVHHGVTIAWILLIMHTFQLHTSDFI